MLKNFKTIVCSVILFCLCSSCQNSIERTLSKMYGQVFVTPFEVRDSLKEYTVIYYLTGHEDSRSVLMDLGRWSKLAKEKINRDDIGFCFILDPNPKDSPASLAAPLRILGPELRVYVDFDKTIKKNNTWIPKDQKYQIFVLDKEMRVVLVGNPVIPSITPLYDNLGT